MYCLGKCTKKSQKAKSPLFSEGLFLCFIDLIGYRLLKAFVLSFFVSFPLMLMSTTTKSPSFTLFNSDILALLQAKVMYCGTCVS